ncbi:uncharacterized protein [Notamacropus eugenii]|uniref:uncharacterized protein n=1 Tax=Notamacropus eugenii TaxID=9315 RepID=UPI003B66E854
MDTAVVCHFRLQLIFMDNKREADRAQGHRAVVSGATFDLSKMRAYKFRGEKTTLSLPSLSSRGRCSPRTRFGACADRAEVTPWLGVIKPLRGPVLPFAAAVMEPLPVSRLSSPAAPPRRLDPP